MKYWAYVNNEIKGPFEKEELLKLEGFNNSTLVCPQSPVEEDTKEWKEASNFPELISTIPIPDKENENVPESLTLNVTSKKEDIMIERFDSDNIFNQVKLEDNRIGSTDPLSFSQIRKREESIAQTAASQSENSKTEIEPQKKSEGTPKENPPTIDIPLPDTESILQSAPNDVVASEEKKEEAIVIDEKPKELNSKVEEFVAKPIEASADVVEFKMDNNISEEKKKEKKVSEVLGNSQSVDISGIKKEILTEIDNKISAIKEKNVSKQDFEIFKEDIKKYVSDTISQISNIKDPELLSHLDIEVKDMRVKIESLEKALAEKDKPKEVQLKDTSVQPQKQSLSSDKTVVMKKEEPPQKKKTIDVSKIVRMFISLIVLLLAIASILFALKRLGIFDITKFVSKPSQNITAEVKKDNQNVDKTQNISPPSANNLAGPGAQNQENFNVGVSTLPGPQPQEPQPVGNNLPDLNNSILNQKDKYNMIVNDVKTYKIKTNKTVEEAIVSVVKSRKGDVNSIEWTIEEKNDLYNVIVKAKGNKEMLFRFEYEPKTRLLKPLNTLSINTLKMLMNKNQKTRKTNKESIRKTKGPDKKNEAKLNNNIDNKKNEQKSDNESQKQEMDNSQSDEEYLIIGE